MMEALAKCFEFLEKKKAQQIKEQTITDKTLYEKWKYCFLQLKDFLRPIPVWLITTSALLEICEEICNLLP